MVPFYFRDIFPIFLLIFIRLVGITITSPIFSSSIIPPAVIIGLMFLVAIILFPFASESLKISIPIDTWSYILLLGNELFIGFSIGLFISIIFTTFQVAGEFFSYQMGLGISEVLDPLSEVEVPVISQVFQVFAMLIFISINGMEYEILVLRKSFELVRYVDFSTKVSALMPQVIVLFRDLFLISLQIAIPIIVTLLILNITLGIISKFAPQVNIFMVGINIQVIIGFILILLYIPFFSTFASNLFNNIFVRIVSWLKLIG
ncbi:MAG: flagellar biosynthetic protein FliR [Spirochaetales bacterium]|nr:flagellar biosynthetic protein FliR [Spirochaetales bacterium]